MAFTSYGPPGRVPASWEWRCYMRDPDGYLIEVGQYTEIALDWFNNHPLA